MESDDTDRDVFQTASVEVAAQLVGLDRGGQTVERAVRVNLAGLGVDPHGFIPDKEGRPVAIVDGGRSLVGRLA